MARALGAFAGDAQPIGIGRAEPDHGAAVCPWDSFGLLLSCAAVEARGAWKAGTVLAFGLRCAFERFAGQPPHFQRLNSSVDVARRGARGGGGGGFFGAFTLAVFFFDFAMLHRLAVVLHSGQ